MTLIYCPECRTVNSQYANACTKCGFPIEKFLQENNFTDLNKIYACPKCAMIYRGSDFQIGAFEPICRHCKVPFIEIPVDINEFNEEYYKNWKSEEFHQKIISLVKTYGNNQFSQEALQNRNAAINRRANEYLQKQKSKDLNVPKCPTCGSTNIRKIGTGERAASVIGFGILSRKINKTWKCNNCSHTW